MSFKVAISDVLIANEALAMLPAGPIVSMDEQSLEARECRRWYKPVVAEMLEKHHWGLATKRTTLAQVLNDRPGEWGFAYATPSDMAFPVSMLGPQGVFSGWTYALRGIYLLLGQPLFIQVAGTIYSNVEMGVLEYTSFDITEANFTFLFKHIVAVELGARICPPITKNETRTQTLTAQAELERQRTIANDMNRSQPVYGTRPTESDYVRFGAYGAVWSGGYPLDPVANPAFAQPANTGY